MSYVTKDEISYIREYMDFVEDLPVTSILKQINRTRIYQDLNIDIDENGNIPGLHPRFELATLNYKDLRDGIIEEMGFKFENSNSPRR